MSLVPAVKAREAFIARDTFDEADKDYIKIVSPAGAFDVPACDLIFDCISTDRGELFRTTRFPIPERYVTVLRSGRIWGDRRVVASDGRLLIDHSHWREGEVIASPDGDVIEVPDGLPTDRFDFPAVILTYGIASASNLSHWMSDVVGKLDIIQQLPAECKVAVHDNTVGYYDQFLKRFGIPEDRIVRISPERISEFSELYVPSKLMAVFTPNTMKIFDRVKGDAPSNNKKARRVYISRSDTKFGTGRNLLNEPEIEDIFREHGFRVLFGKDLSLDSSIEIMNSADVIAGPYGAGLYHGLFANLGTDVVALTHSRYSLPHIFQISGLRQHKLHVVLGEHFDSDDFHFKGNHSNFIISPDVIRRVLRSVLG